MRDNSEGKVLVDWLLARRFSSFPVFQRPNRFSFITIPTDAFSVNG
jgi:hypothetical protein